jgi:hypothetical protein
MIFENGPVQAWEWSRQRMNRGFGGTWAYGPFLGKLLPSTMVKNIGF